MNLFIIGAGIGFAAGIVSAYALCVFAGWKTHRVPRSGGITGTKYDGSGGKGSSPSLSEQLDSMMKSDP